MQLRKPRTDDRRENDRWQEDIADQASAGKTASENELLFWFLHEDRNPEPRNEEGDDVEDVRTLLDAQSFPNQEIMDHAMKLKDLEILHFMEV